MWILETLIFVKKRSVWTSCAKLISFGLFGCHLKLEEHIVITFFYLLCSFALLLSLIGVSLICYQIIYVAHSFCEVTLSISILLIVGSGDILFLILSH